MVTPDASSAAADPHSGGVPHSPLFTTLKRGKGAIPQRTNFHQNKGTPPLQSLDIFSVADFGLCAPMAEALKAHTGQQQWAYSNLSHSAQSCIALGPDEDRKVLYGVVLYGVVETQGVVALRSTHLVAPVTPHFRMYLPTVGSFALSWALVRSSWDPSLSGAVLVQR